jgi:putative peptidoglycan lipid II flippase
MPTLAQVARLFQGSTVNRRILRAATTVTAAGIVVKLVATLKEFVVAGVYGRSDAMDAFLAANLIPGLLINLISESMNQALVPTLIRVREREGHEQAQRLLSSSMVSICVLLAGASLLMGFTARAFFPLIASHFAPAKFNLAVQLFYGLLPLVLITGIATNCTAVLNTIDRFTWPSLAPVAVPVGVMLGAWFLSSRMGPWAMVAGSLTGATAQAVWVGWMMDAHGYRFRLRWYGLNEATREVAQQYWPMLLSSIVASGGLLVDQSMAAMLSPGSVSTLAYAGRFVSVVLTLLAGAISTAVTPYLSRLIALEDWAGCRHTIRTWVRLTALISTPLALLLIAGSHWLVRATYQHGAFGPRDTAVVAPVLIMYAVQIPFIATSRVFYKFLVAMRRNDLVLWCGILNLILDVIFNLLLMRRFGVAGIALATSLWAATTFFFFGYWTYRLLPKAATGAEA